MSKTNSKLSARDFLYVYEPGIGQAYQNGAYLITLSYGPFTHAYTAHYRDQKIGWYEDFLSAVDACARHEALRKGLDGHYTQRCEQAETGVLPRVSRHREDK